MKIYEVSYESDEAGSGYKHIFCPTMKIAKAVKRTLLATLTKTEMVYGEDDHDAVEMPLKASEIVITDVEFSTEGGMKESACRIAYSTTDALDLALPWWKYGEAIKETLDDAGVWVIEP